MEQDVALGTAGGDVALGTAGGDVALGTAGGDSAAGPDLLEKYRPWIEAFESEQSRTGGRKIPATTRIRSDPAAANSAATPSALAAGLAADLRSELRCAIPCEGARAPTPTGPKTAYSSAFTSGYASSVNSAEPWEGPCWSCVRPRGTFGYFCWCLLVTSLSSAATVILWSSIGVGDACLGWLIDYYEYRFVAMSASATIFTMLYVSDFYCPPHLPGKYFRLWERDILLGRIVFSLGLGLLILSILLFARLEPSVPLTVTICLGPAGVGSVWLGFPGVVMPTTDKEQGEAREIVQKMQVLHYIRDNEAGEVHLYKGSLGAFMFCALMVFAVWVAWVVQGNTLESFTDGNDPNDHHTILILWVTPVFASISNLMFGLFVLLRVVLHHSYSHTNDLRNSLLVDILRGMETEIKSRKRESKQAAKELEKELIIFQHMQLNNKHRLQVIMKVVVASLATLLGLIFVMGRLVYANSKITSVIMEMAAIFLCGFIAFAYVSFRRIIKALGASLLELRACKIVLAALQKEWPKALFICFVAPAVPPVLLLSALTKLVRRCRGIDEHGPLHPGEFPLRRALLTTKVVDLWENTYKWSSTTTIFWCYVACGVYVLCTLTPLILNIGLAWLNKQMAGFPFYVVILILFVVGIITFMLPPVPGAVVYLFGGLVLADTCPWGFWAGSILNILVCLMMKLMACAVQQKCIGEMLGRHMWVRQAVGVHRMGIRCVESILKRPGWSWGKVAILCGGPDWPTSVLAGILGLSLVQCELATLPILGFIAPCALTGSLYIKRGTSELWTRLANLMIGLSGVVSLTLIVTIAWALQCELDGNISELARPLKENVHLHWLDHRYAEIKMRSAVCWADIPTLIKVLYCVGAAFHIAVFHAFLWGFQNLFGTFNVTDSIDDVKFHGPGGLLNRDALAILGIYAVGWICYFSFSCFQKAKAHGPKHEAMADLDMQEALWKERWLHDLENWDLDSARGRSLLGEHNGSQASEDAGQESSHLSSQTPVESMEDARQRCEKLCVEQLEDAMSRGAKAQVADLEERVMQLRSLVMKSESSTAPQAGGSGPQSDPQPDQDEQVGRDSPTSDHLNPDLDRQVSAEVVGSTPTADLHLGLDKDGSEQATVVGDAEAGSAGDGAQANSSIQISDLRPDTEQAATAASEVEAQAASETAQAADTIVEIVSVCDREDTAEANLAVKPTPESSPKGRENPESQRSTAATDEVQVTWPLAESQQLSGTPSDTGRNSLRAARRKSCERWSCRRSSSRPATPCPPRPNLPQAPQSLLQLPRDPPMQPAEAHALVDPNTEFAVSLADTLPLSVRIPPPPASLMP